MSNYVYKSCLPGQDQQSVTDFIYTLKEEFLLPDRKTAEKVTAHCFEQGGIFGGYVGGELNAILGFFYGEPDRNYTNKEVAFLYVAGIAKEYRMSRLCYQGLIFALKRLQEAGFREIRLQAEAGNPYTNRLYARFAKPLGSGLNPRGIPINNYGGSIASALNYLERFQRPLSQKRSYAPLVVS